MNEFVVSQVNTVGIIVTIAGTGTYGFTADGGPATAAMLSNPRGVAVSATGDVFIAEMDNQKIRKVSYAILRCPSRNSPLHRSIPWASYQPWPAKERGHMDTMGTESPQPSPHFLTLMA